MVISYGYYYYVQLVLYYTTRYTSYLHFIVITLSIHYYSYFTLTRTFNFPILLFLCSPYFPLTLLLSLSYLTHYYSYYLISYNAIPYLSLPLITFHFTIYLNSSIHFLILFIYSTPYYYIFTFTLYLLP